MESARSIEPDHPFETLPAEGITAVFFCTLLLFLLSFQKYNELFCVEGNSVTQAFPGITQSTTGIRNPHLQDHSTDPTAVRPMVFHSAAEA